MIGRRVLGDPPAGDPVRARLLGTPRHRHRAGRTGGLPLSAAALLPPAAVGLVVLLGVRALRRAPRPGEGLLAAEAFLRTATREEPSAAVLSPDGLGALHVAVYAAVTRAFDRADTLVAVGRELLLVATITSAVLLWGIARRLGFGHASAAGAILLAGVPALLSGAAVLDVPAAARRPVAAPCRLADRARAPGRPRAGGRSVVHRRRRAARAGRTGAAADRGGCCPGDGGPPPAGDAGDPGDRRGAARRRRRRDRRAAPGPHPGRREPGDPARSRPPPWPSWSSAVSPPGPRNVFACRRSRSWRPRWWRCCRPAGSRRW